MARVEGAWTVNHAAGRSKPSWVKLTKSLQQTSNFKIPGSFGFRIKPGSPVYHNNIVGTLKVHFCPSHSGQVSMLPGAVSLDMLSFVSLWITLTVPEVVGTEN